MKLSFYNVKFWVLTVFTVLSVGVFCSSMDEYKGEIKVLDERLSKKMEIDGYSNYSMNQASIEYYNEMEKLMEKYYNRLMDELNPEEKLALKNSQRAWIKYRDSQTDFVYLYLSDMGSMGTILRTENRSSLLENRIKELVELLNYREF